MGEEAPSYVGLGGLRGSALGRGNVVGRLSLMEGLTPHRGGRLLDVGCGDGAYTLELAEYYDSVVGIDIEPDRLERFRRSAQSPSVEVLLVSGTSTPFADAEFDAVTMIETLEHLGDGLQQTLSETARVLRSGGTLYITTPNRLWPLEQHGFEFRGRRHAGWRLPLLTWVPPLHRRLSPDDAFTPSRVDGLVEPHGFVRTGLSYMFPPLDRRPALRRLLGPVWGVLQSTPLRCFGQTLVLAYERSPAGSNRLSAAGRGSRMGRRTRWLTRPRGPAPAGS